MTIENEREGGGGGAEALEDGVKSGDGGAGERAARPSEEDAALRLWIVLARSYLTFSRALGAKVMESGLTIPQLGILDALHHLGPLSLGELAEKLLVTGGNITYVMDRLEDQGLVFRQRSETDRRVVEAHLTPEGSELIESSFPDHARHVRDLVDHLSQEEQRELSDLLKRLGKGIGGKEAEV